MCLFPDISSSPYLLYTARGTEKRREESCRRETTADHSAVHQEIGELPESELREGGREEEGEGVKRVVWVREGGVCMNE